VILFCLSANHTAQSQRALPRGSGEVFDDTSSFWPPAGARVAIIEFDDLECGFCAAAFPIVQAAATRYGIPLVHHDYPLAKHVWSYAAACHARDLEHKASLEVANEYRGSIFAHQSEIKSREGLRRFSEEFYRKHSLPMPTDAEIKSTLADAVRADIDLGHQIGIHYTPTIVVASAKEWIEVVDVRYLDQAVRLVMKDIGMHPVEDGRR